MQPSARESYLVTEVMTATPQKLQLMLIEAAIRAAERAREKWHTQEDEQAGEALIHAQQVVGELLASLNQEVEPELVEKVASVYLFVFRNLMEANYERNEKKLDDALRVLQVERETWRQVCKQLGSSKPSSDQAALKPSEQPAAPPSAAAEPPQLADFSPGSGKADDSSVSGFSLEA